MSEYSEPETLWPETEGETSRTKVVRLPNSEFVVHDRIPRLQANVIIALLSLLLILAIYVAFGRQPNWEYKIEAVDDLSFVTDINALGKDGWELVTARRATSGTGEASKASYEMIFKRPKRW